MSPPKRILLVDDEPGITSTVKFALGDRRKYSVLEENNSLHALQRAREFRPDLILLDVMMPGCDGGDVARQIEADSTLRGTPIIFLTGLVAEEESAAGEVLGGYRFIAKPLRFRELVSCVDTVLEAVRPGPFLPPEPLQSPAQPA